MKPARTWRKVFVFRLAAVAIGLLPFCLFELALHGFGVGTATEADLPAIGFESIRPLFELSSDGERYEISPSRLAYFCPDSFATNKGDDEFRIFCLGGSTVQGRPYSIETSFTTWLELSLKAADQRREWEVVNCGGVSYGSHRLVPILDEVLRYKPDLVVIYTGHNEFLEAGTFGRPGDGRGRWPAAAWLSHLRTYNLLLAARRGPREPVLMPEEVDALLDYRGGLADYHRDAAWRREAVAQYEANLRKMLQMANDAGVPVVLLNPVSNLKDCPPFKVEGSVGLSAAKQREFESLWTRAKAATSIDARIELLEAAISIDPQHAAARFLLGHAYLARYQIDEAREQLQLAKEEDVCPLRMIEPLHDALRTVAAQTGTPLLDIRRVFEDASEAGIPGDRWLLDHIHPSISGHQMIAAQLMSHLIETGVVVPVDKWQDQRARLYAKHLGTLDAVYYAKGKQRLEGLRRWTQGRANKLRDGTTLPPGLDDN
jgi:lysophospholipase L1-like esterase